MADELTGEVRRREEGGRSLSGLVGDEVRRLGSSPERAAANAAWIAWSEVNGDVERAHTTGVYVGAPRRGASDPELTVYVDSAAYLTDFSANREVYLARLETAGLRFSRISFRRSRQQKAAPPRPRAGQTPRPSLRELTEAERREVSDLCSQLPESLRDSVSRAMSASYRAQSEQHS